LEQNQNHTTKLPISIWLTGLSGAGKTTLANELHKALKKRGYLTKVLDGDLIRKGLNKDLGFSETDRVENIRRIAEVSKLFLDAGIITINSFICPTNVMQEKARSIIGDEFIQVYVSTPLEVCECRDTKGLYAKARKGEVGLFTGVTSNYEAPINPEITINTTNKSIQASLKELENKIISFL